MKCNILLTNTSFTVINYWSVHRVVVNKIKSGNFIQFRFKLSWKLKCFELCNHWNYFQKIIFPKFFNLMYGIVWNEIYILKIGWRYFLILLYRHLKIFLYFFHLMEKLLKLFLKKFGKEIVHCSVENRFFLYHIYGNTPTLNRKKIIFSSYF